METPVHAHDPRKALQEYGHSDEDECPKGFACRNTVPMSFAIVPYLFFQLLGLETKSIPWRIWKDVVLDTYGDTFK